MSLLKSIGRIAGSLITGGPVAAVTTAVGGLMKTPKPTKTITVSSGGGGKGGLPTLPGGASYGGGLGKVAAGLGAGAIIWDAVTGQPRLARRRRRKGISARDLSSFKRVARLIDKYAAPVHHLRKSSFKTHHQ